MIKKITEISYSKINQNIYSLRKNQIIYTSRKGKEQHAMMVEPILWLQMQTIGKVAVKMKKEFDNSEYVI